MTLRADIQTGLREVIDALGETGWYYRRLTSGPAADTRGYGSWTAVTAHVTARNNQQEWDPERNVWKRIERMRFRVSDTLADLHQGDQVKDSNGVTYAVVGINSNAVNTGTIAYDCERTVPLRVESGSREGGV